MHLLEWWLGRLRFGLPQLESPIREQAWADGVLLTEPTWVR